MDSDGELLERVNEVDDFLGCVFFRDALVDWNLAKEFGEFLLRTGDTGPMAHALLARAHRHLGNLEQAREQLKQCKVRVATGELTPSEEETFTGLLAQEEKLLSQPDGP